MTWAERRLDGAGNGSVGLDATLFFSPTFGFTGQAIQSYGEFAQGTEAFFLRPAYDSPTGHLHVRYTHLGDRFGDNVNVVGFVRDDDRREVDAAAEKTIWFDTGPLEMLEYASILSTALISILIDVETTLKDTRPIAERIRLPGDSKYRTLITIKKSPLNSHLLSLE